MATHDGVPAEEPLDPVYAALFRPPSEQDLQPVAAPEPAASEDPRDTQDPDEPGPAAVAASGAARPTADTGRLFRSQGVSGHESAVLAIDNGRRLRTLERTEVPSPAPVPVAASDAGTASPVAPSAPTASDDAPVTVSPGRGRRQISAGAVYLIVFGVTLLVAFADALIFGGELGWPTGVALLVSSAYCALTVRREDDVVAIITPPLAFLLAAMTAGQFFRGPTAGDVLNRAQLVFFTLAYNWYWIIGSTLLALIVVLVRRRR